MRGTRQETFKVFASEIKPKLVETMDERRLWRGEKVRVVSKQNGIEFGFE